MTQTHSPINLYQDLSSNNNNQAPEEENSCFISDFLDGVSDALEFTSTKILIGIQMILFLAIVVVTLSMSQSRLIQVLETAYTDVTHDVKSSTPSNPLDDHQQQQERRDNELPRVIGRYLGKAMLKYWSSTSSSSSTTSTNTTGDEGSILDGSVARFISQVMMSPFPQAAVSIGRALVYTQQLVPVERYSSSTLNNWAYAHCNYSESYPSFYPPQVCCYRNYRECCSDWSACSWCWGCYSWTKPVENSINSVVSTISSYIAPLYFFDQVSVSPSQLGPNATSPGAFAPLDLTGIFGFIGAQGNLSALTDMGRIPCDGFIASARKLNLAGSFFDASENVTRDWSYNLSKILNTMEKVCGKAKKLDPVTNAPLPTIQQQVEKKPSATLRSPSSSTNDNNTPNNNADPISAVTIITIVFGSIIAILSLILVVILIRSIFGWISCRSSSNTQVEVENNNNVDDDEEEDLVDELFNRPRNQILLLVNCILILAIAFACVSAVSYKQYLDKAQTYVEQHVQGKTPQQLGVEVGKVFYEMYQNSNNNNNNNVGSATDPMDGNSTDFMGVTSSIPRLIKNVLLLNYQDMFWKMARFTTKLDASLMNLCRESTNAGIIKVCSSDGLAKFLRRYAGSIHGSLSPNLVFGSYEGNVALQPPQGSSSPSSNNDDETSFFDPISLIEWASDQLAPVGAYHGMNIQGCQPFASALRQVPLYGSFVTGSGTLITWDYRSVRNTIADGISYVCGGVANADSLTTTATISTTEVQTTTTGDQTTIATTAVPSTTPVPSGQTTAIASSTTSVPSDQTTNAVPSTTPVSSGQTTNDVPSITPVPSGQTTTAVPSTTPVPSGQTTAIASSTTSVPSDQTTNAIPSTTPVSSGQTTNDVPSTTPVSSGQTTNDIPSTSAATTTSTTTTAAPSTTFQLTFNTPAGPTVADLQASLQSVLTNVSSKDTVKLVVVSNTTNTQGNRVIEFKLESTSSTPSTSQQEALTQSVVLLNDKPPTQIASSFGAAQFAPEQTATTAAPVNDDSSKFPIAIVVGAVVGAIVLAGIIFFVVRRNRWNTADRGQVTTQTFEVGILSSYTQPEEVMLQAPGRNTRETQHFL